MICVRIYWYRLFKLSEKRARQTKSSQIDQYPSVDPKTLKHWKSIYSMMQFLNISKNTASLSQTTCTGSDARQVAALRVYHVQLCLASSRCPYGCWCVCFGLWLTSEPESQGKWKGFLSDSLCYSLWCSRKAGLFKDMDWHRHVDHDKHSRSVRMEGDLRTC